MTVIWVDVSFHDRNRRKKALDWAAIRAATSEVMCSRVSYGDPAGFNPATPFVAEFHDGAKDAGFTLRGGYHDLVRGDAASIARQVDLLRAQLDSVDANWAMADCEPFEELVQKDLWPRAEDIRRFHDRWYAVEQRVCAWYIPHWFWDRTVARTGLGRPDLTGLRGPLVQSHFPTVKGAAAEGTAAEIYHHIKGDAGVGWDDRFGARAPDIWQFSAATNVAGASSRTDVNAFRGTVAELRSLLTIPEADMPLSDEDRKVIRQLAMLGVFDALAAAARRDTPTGRQLGDNIITLLQPTREDVRHLASTAGRILSAVTTAPAPVVLDAEQVTKLADRVAAAVVAAPHNSLSPKDLDAVRETVRLALHEGVGG
jgi:hypothetical protein